MSYKRDYIRSNDNIVGKKFHTLLTRFRNIQLWRQNWQDRFVLFSYRYSYRMETRLCFSFLFNSM